MKTKSVTLSVLRTSYAQLDITAHVPVDATQEQIREAVLDEAHNQVFSEHSSEVELESDYGDEGEVRARKALKNLLQSLIDVGFGASGPIEGSEAINAASAFFDNLGMHLFGTGIEAGVVHSESQRGFWRDGDGWGSCELATVFLDRSFSMPGVADATFVPLDAIDVFGKTLFVSKTGLSLPDALNEARAIAADEADDIDSLTCALHVLNRAQGDHQLAAATIQSAMH
jgi:hypothetical protein